jgi:predicted Zn-dependent protease
MIMSLRSIVVVLVAIAGVAQAAPKKAPKDSPRVQKKLSKKQLEIEKHEWMAQYYLRRADDLEGAAKEYKAILALEPDNVRAGVALASIYTRGKKDKLAVEVLTKLTKKNPKNEEAWLVLAELQLTTGDDKGMKASLDKVVALDPTNTDAYELLFVRAYKKFKGGETSAKAEALDAARKLMLLTRRQGPTYRIAERAVVEMSGEKIDLVVYDAKQAYAQAFDSPVIGNINARMATARKGFEECLQIQPKNEQCHYQLGLVYSSVKASDAYDPKKALAELQQAPTLPLAWVETGRLQRASDDNVSARGSFEKALKLDGSLAVAHVELGIIDKVEGKIDAAATHFVTAVDADPYGSIGDRALAELSKVKPTHPYVTEGVLEGKRAGDVFSSDRYKAVVEIIERELGGVDNKAPERAVLDEIVQRLIDGSGIKQQFHVALVNTQMVNAFALADGRVYVTRGLIDMLKKKFPQRPIDANNDVLGHILGHELQHVIRRHTLNSVVFQEAVKDASRPLDPSVLTHVTRLHEIDADRQGMVMAFLAGYHPRGGIEFMEVMGGELEIPKHLDHPTFEERVEYLTEYWTNDVRYAFVSFKLGVAAMDRGGKLEGSDMKAAVGAYDEAVEDFKRYRTMLPNLKEAMNDLGIAYAKLGVLAMAAGDSPLTRWQTRFSLERDSAVKWVGLARKEEQSLTRGSTEKARLPWQMREAIAQFKEAIATDENYAKARLNLATAYIAANQLDNARDTLAKVDAKGGVVAGDIELIRGIMLAEGKDYDKAKASFEKAIGSQAAKRAASYNLARALELAGKKPEAKRAYEQYVKLFPGGPWAAAAQAAAAKM